jgi:O-antigen/teichoic acid export membrane protein
MKLTLLRTGAIYSLANALSAGVPFLLLPVLTRALTPEDYGMVISFFLLVSLSSSIAGLNAHGAVAVRWFDRRAPDFASFVGAALVIAVASSLVCGLVLAIASVWLRSELELAPGFWFLAAVQAGASIVLAIRTSLWQSQGLALSAASLQVAGAVLNVGLSLFAVFFFALGGIGRIGGAVAASLVAAGLAVWLLLRAGDARHAASKADLRALLRFGAPLIPHSLAGVLLATADRFSVSAVLGREALGIYGTAAQVGMSMGILGDAIVKASSPWMYRQLSTRSARGNLRMVGATYVLIPAWFATAAVLWLLFEAAGSLLLDSRYLPAIDLSIWFFLGGAVTAVYNNIAGLFFFTSKNEWLSLATVSAAGVAIVLAPILTTRAGLTGAALSYLAAQALFLALAWALSLRVQPMPWNRPGLAVRMLVRQLRER